VASLTRGRYRRSGLPAPGEGNCLLFANASTGQSIFTYDAGSYFYGAPTITNGMVYSADYAGNLLAFDQ
jgi:outer membrane protein assembly factor BamB